MEPSVAQALVMVDELIRCGVSDIVLGAGSRSAPLALAAASAEARGEVRVHVRVDERVAGFLALGIGKATGVPAAVITTSGTAAVNVLPAIVEAHESSVPLLVVTADRPPRLRGVGANQTIDQVGAFSAYTRMDVDMDTAGAGSEHNRYWRSTVSRCVAVATDSINPGPVHLNVPFDAPLVGAGIVEALPEHLRGREDHKPWTADARLVAGMSIPLDEALVLLDESATVPTRGVIVVGDHDDDDTVDLVDELCDALGWPVISEPSGRASSADTGLAHGPLVCDDESFRSAHTPEMVLTVGRVGLYRSVLHLIESAGMHIAIDTSSQWSDPTRSADLVLAAVPLPPTEARIDPQWWGAWERADLLAAAAVETVLGSDTDIPTGMHVARVVADVVPPDGQLFLAASSVVRYVGSFAGRSLAEVNVVGNRGASGIDGCVSTAWGVALGAQASGGGPAVALVGDEAFWYDSNALAVPAGELRPDLTIVVVDNDGGGIFSTLEQGAPVYEQHFERVFGVPLGIRLDELAQSYGTQVHRVEDTDQLRRTVEDCLGAGVQVIVVRTSERKREAQILEGIQDAVRQAIGSA
ncbi:MAG TPA: 2-succinyl-5-enolpyruvyl-6-hydroxy-3-cyclohexene-1-carboxylic-acid synthase [Candidatus Nanopelagicales bacterium]|nr:2-succinyl-5-enolpyruvyl-6-hydroxy-3-cyclohexene-1-carboxylic-acid synthase [Candidatus Nanopelagicales bacterium]